MPPNLPDSGESPAALSATAAEDLRQALEGSGDGWWEWDIVHGTHSQSARWWEILGYSVDDPRPAGVGEFSDRVHPDDLLMVQQAGKNYLSRTVQRSAVEFRMRCKDGRWKWILSRAQVVEWTAQGTPARMIGTHTDIDAFHKAQVALRALNARLLEQAEQLHTTLDSVSQGVLLCDAQGHIDTHNQQLCEILRVDAQWLRAHPTRQALVDFQHARGDFGPGYELVDAHARDSVARRDESTLPAQYRRRTPDGRTLEIHTRHLANGGMVRTFSDLTGYLRSEAARARFDNMLDAVQRISRVGCAMSNFAERTVEWTDGIYRLLDVDPADYTPTIGSIAQFLSPASHAELLAVMKDSAHQPTRHETEQQLVTLRGRTIWVKTIAFMTWRDGRVLTRTSFMQDITEHRLAQERLRESEERWKLALESAGDGVWDWHIAQGHEFFSQRLLDMYGFSEDELRRSPDELDRRTHPDDLEAMHRAREDHFAGRTPSYHNEHRVQCKDGSWKWILTRGMVISRDPQERPLRMIGTHTDITARKEAEAVIRHQALFDTLTGLPNRRMLRDRLEQEMRRCQRDGQQLAVLFMDLDHFKEINDTLGHDQGDVLLVEASRRIQGCLRACDTVARMGGDEFTIVLSDMEDATHLEGLLQKLLHTLASAFELQGEPHYVSASIGVTIYPLDGQEIETLFKNADQALYAAKGAGRNRFSFFTPALQEAAQKRVRLAQDLRNALQHNQFRLVYQPIVHMASGVIHKAEALLRWEHPLHGTISPAEFIPVAESSGLIVEIGQWVFEQAALQVRQWRTQIAPQFQISINKSPVQFLRVQAGARPWGETLQSLGLPGNAIVVEITEGLLLEKAPGVAEQLLALGDAGIQVSLDDFGTGYSSLAYLQRFDIDFIKIDQSFVRHLIQDSTDMALCKAIIAMAHALGIQVVAEGVETAVHYDLLRAVGCDYAQGYFVARPLPAPAFTALVQQLHANQ